MKTMSDMKWAFGTLAKEVRAEHEAFVAAQVGVLEALYIPTTSRMFWEETVMENDPIESPLWEAVREATNCSYTSEKQKKVQELIAQYRDGNLESIDGYRDIRNMFKCNNKEFADILFLAALAHAHAPYQTLGHLECAELLSMLQQKHASGVPVTPADTLNFERQMLETYYRVEDFAYHQANISTTSDVRKELQTQFDRKTKDVHVTDKINVYNAIVKYLIARQKTAPSGAGREKLVEYYVPSMNTLKQELRAEMEKEKQVSTPTASGPGLN